VTADYVVRRFAVLLLVVFVGGSVNFLIPHLTPGDPVEARLAELAAGGGGQVVDLTAMVALYDKRFGLDQPLWRQYLHFWTSFLHGDLGVSLANFPGRVADTIEASLPWTLGLFGTSTLIAFALGTLLGGLFGWPGAPRGVRAAIPVLMLFSAIPYFLLAVILVFLFAIQWRIFPAGGGYAFGGMLRWDLPTLWTLVQHGTLPAASIVLAQLGAWALTMRGMMISTLGEDYVILAEAKGLGQRRVFLAYAMRNALLPQVTTLALSLGHVVSGALLVEVVFAYPGIGFQLYQAILAKDFFVIQGIVMLLVVSISLTLFILDLVYPLIDPRIVYRRT